MVENANWGNIKLFISNQQFYIFLGKQSSSLDGIPSKATTSHQISQIRLENIKTILFK
jgi:hypothetical protein